MRDCASASVNNVAMPTVCVLYSKNVDIEITWERNLIPLLQPAFCFSCFSPKKNRLAWKSQTDHATTTYSDTRLWSLFEVMKQIHGLFGDVERFVATVDLSTATKLKLLHIMNNPNLKSQLIWSSLLLL